MVKSTTFEPKKAIGVGLRPSLWNRIDRYAETQGKSRAQVIEEVLAAHIPVVRDLRETEVESTNGEARFEDDGDGDD